MKHTADGRSVPFLRALLVGEKTPPTLSFVFVHPDGGSFLAAAQAVTVANERAVSTEIGLCERRAAEILTGSQRFSTCYDCDFRLALRSSISLASKGSIRKNRNEKAQLTPVHAFGEAYILLAT